MNVKDYLATVGGESKKKGSPEHDEQVRLFEWASLMSNNHPELELLFAIPNGASYGGGGGRWNIAKRMKEEGVKKGVPDVFLAVPMIRQDPLGNITEMNAGLWIEMKAGKNRPSEDQKWWIEKLETYGYRVQVCYSAEEAIEAITEYLK